MSLSKEDQIKGLLEDIDVHKFIHDDLVTTRPGDSESIAETLQQIKLMENQVARLLGQTPTNSSAASSEPSTANTSAVPSASATPPGPASSWTPRHMPMPPALLQMPPRLPLRTAIIPNDPVSTQYWPSSAPSPFAASPRYEPRPPVPTVSMDNRKRGRQDSGSSAHHAQPPKRTATERSDDRVRKIREKLRVRLAENQDVYDAMRTPESVEYTASIDGISEAEALRNIDEEQADSERNIRTLAQMEEDEELARLLQAEEEPSDYGRNSIPQPPTQPHVNPTRPFHFGAEPSALDIRPKLEPGLHTPMRGSLPSHHPSDSDSDLEEISADFYHSNFGGLPVRMPSRMLPPPSQFITMPGGPMPMPRAPVPLPGQPSTMPGYPPLGRTLPWENHHHESRAFDLVREQQELDDDEVDFEYVL